MPGSVIRFFFGTHISKDDALASRDDFEWCTVFCPEGTGCGPTHGLMYDYLSRGVFDARTAYNLIEPPGGPFELVQLMMMQGSGKQIELVDVPDGHVLNDRLSSICTSLTTVAFRDIDFSQACDDTVSDFTDFVKWNREREQYIVNGLCRLDAELVNERVLVRLGACHCFIVKQAVSRGLAVERVFQRGTHYASFSLCYHYINCGLSMPPNILERYILTELLLRYTSIAATVPLYSDTERILWKTAKVFGADEIAELWGRCQSEPDNGADILLKALRIRDLA